MPDEITKKGDDSQKKAFCFRALWGVYLTIMDSTPTQIGSRAHCKINLGLRVTGKRTDGYHDILTVFHRVGLFDDILLSVSDAISVHATDPAVPSDESNICHAAARALAETLGGGNGVRIDITKRVPAGAGLGGGSADAAAVLRTLPGLWGSACSEDALRALALRLGSDVPFFLGDRSAVGSGRGDVLEYFILDVPFAILLCIPPVHVATAWAYSRVAPRPGVREDIRSLLHRGMSDPALLRASLVNDFEPPVFREYPVIRSVKESMERDGALFASMSGTGSSVYGLFEDAARAEIAAGPLEELEFRTSVTPPHFRV
jgi:4-diphosphocytidyl-2-C-methyl-D-erythritol kinase